MIPLELEAELRRETVPQEMISSIQIKGFRGFSDFEMRGLGRVNLLVGTNNSGKTSVLEAIDLLTSRGEPISIWNLLWRRGETLTTTMFSQGGAPSRPVQQQVEADVSHLFTGHEVHPGSSFSFIAKNETPERTITFTAVEPSTKERRELFGSDDDGESPSRLALTVKGTPTPPIPILPLSRNGGMSQNVLEQRRRRRETDGRPSQLITTDSLTSAQLVTFWDKVVLTSAENMVLDALRCLDPDIERIAPQSGYQQFYYGTTARPGGFLVKRKGIEQPIPIGSMGDGMWRMLAMAISISQCRGGVLLVDEIDTGLHYTVMADMWRLIFGAAKEFDVQVFATTHSFDCIESLATVCVSDNEAPNTAVTLQRIESGTSRAIPYSENEIKIASERNLEVR
jgi:hypothetical protein